MSNCTNVSDSEFEKVVIEEKSTPVLVDFWAEWCGPCKMLAPVLEEVAEHYGEKVKIVKIDIEENSLTPSKYGVRGIPTIMLFKDGELVETKVGNSPKNEYIKLIDRHL